MKIAAYGFVIALFVTFSSTAQALSLSMTTTPQSTSAGESVLVELVASNESGSSESGVTVQMTYPANLNSVGEAAFSGPLDEAASCDTNTTCTSGELIVWNLGTLDPGEVVHMSFPTSSLFSVPDDTVITFDADMIQSSSTVETASASIVVESPQGFSLDLSEDQNPVAPGSELTYRLNFGNITTGNIDNSVLTLNLPSNTTFVSATGGGSHSAGVVTWTLNTLVANQIDTLEAVVTVAGGLSNGTLLAASAEITGDVGVAETAAEQAGIIGHVQASTPLSMAITLNSNPENDASTSLVEITVSNPGSVTQSGVTMDMRWPVAINSLGEGFFTGPFDAASSCVNTVCSPDEIAVWNFGSLAPGQTEVTTFPVSAFSSTPDGTVFRFAPKIFAGGSVIEETANLTIKANQLSLDLSESQDPVVPGSQQTYRLSWGNVTTGNIDNTELTFRLPADTTFVSATDGGTHSNGVVTWDMNTLVANQIDTFEVVVDVAGSLADGTLLEASAEIVGEAGVAQIAAEQASTVSHVQASAPLTMAITVNSNPENDAFTSLVEITVSNPGTVTQSGVSMEMRWPASINSLGEGFFTGPFDEASSCVNTVCSPDEIAVWNFGSLAPGQTEVTTFPVSAFSSTPDGTVFRFAPKIFAGGSVIEETANLTIKANQLSLDLSESQDPVAPGSQQTYRLSWGNVTTGNIDNTELTFRLPADTTFVSATDGGTHSNGVVTWDMNTLVANQIDTFEVVVDVAGSLADGTLLEASAEIVGEAGVAQIAAEQASTVSHVQASAPLTMAITVNSNPENDAFTSLVEITVSNPGTVTQSGVSMEMRWPASINSLGEGFFTGPFDEASSCVNTVCSPDEIAVWNFGSLAPGQTEVTTFPVSAFSSTADGTIFRFAPKLFVNDVTIEESANLTIKANQLSLDLSESQDPVLPGSLLTYVISGGNVTTGNINNTVLTFTLPENTTFVSASDGGTHANGVVTWTLNTLPAGDIGRVEVVVDVAGNLTNGTLLEGVAEIVGDAGISNVAAERSTTVTHVQLQPPLTMAVSINPDPESDFTSSWVEVIVSNPGSVTQSGVTMEMRWPAGINSISETLISGAIDAASSCVNTTCSPDELVVWNFGSLAPGQTEVTTFPVSAFSSTVDGTIFRFTPRLFVNDFTIEETATLTIKEPDLDLALDTAEYDGRPFNQVPMSPGERIVYTLKYGNVSGGNLDNARLTFEVPTGTSYQDGTNVPTFESGIVTWDLGTLNAGEVGEQKVKVLVLGPGPDGTLLEANASIDSDDGAARRAKRVSFINRVHPLTLDLTLSPFPSLSAEVINVTLTATNVSGGAVSGALIEMRYPFGFAGLSESSIEGIDAALSCGGNTFCTEGERLFWNLGTLDAGAQSTFTFSPSLNSLATGSVVTALATLIEGNDSLALASASTVIAASRTDTDGDGIGNDFDNCTTTSNFEQIDFELDSRGDVCDPDDDNDGLRDTDELLLGTSPFNKDTDGDGGLDGIEVRRGLDPLNPNDWPTFVCNPDVTLGGFGHSLSCSRD